MPETLNLGLSLFLGNFESLDKDMVQSLSVIGSNFENNLIDSNSSDQFQKKSKEECEEEYKALFLGGLIDKITKQTYSKVKNDSLQIQEGFENLFFESETKIHAKRKQDSNVDEKKTKFVENIEVSNERLQVNNLDIVKWEDEIIWEDSKEEQSANLNSFLLLDEFEEEIGHWGRLQVSSQEEEIEQTKPFEIIPIIASETPKTNQEEAFNHPPIEFSQKKRKYRKKKSETLVETKSNSNNFKKTISLPKEDNLSFLNAELLNCNWLDEIYWDDCCQPKEDKLILDLNDKSMIFDIDLESKDDKNEMCSVDDLIHSSCKEGTYTKETIPKKFHVLHSKPALELDSKYYKLFPKGKEAHEKKGIHFKKNEPFELSYQNPKRKIKSIQTRKDLSATDNQLILLEYVERNPSLVNKFGMGTNIVNYCKKPKTFQPIPNFKNGKTVMVENEDEIPLISNLEFDGKISTIQNNMFSSQIFEQQVKNVDFIVCCRKSSKGSEWIIREIPTEYTVGHIQPIMEVYPPRTRALDSYINNALTYYICKMFKDKISKGRTPKISVNEIIEKFNEIIPRQTVRDKLKELANFNRKDDIWIAVKENLPTDEELSRMVTPEMICMNESMVYGDYKLNCQNIDDRSDMVAYELSFSKLEDKYRQLIKIVERIKNNLPWEQTSNFQLCFKSSKENVKLELLEVVQQNVKKIEPFIKEIKKLIDLETEEILPSMTDSEARRILIDSNKFKEEAIVNMNRSERKSNARRIAKQTQENFSNSSTADEDLGKRKAKNLARISVFKEGLRDVYLTESIKLSNGLNFYETSDRQIEEIRNMGRESSTTFQILDNDSLSTNSVQSRNDVLDQFETGTDSDKPKKRGRKKKNPISNLTNQFYVKKTTIVNDSTHVEYIHNPTRVSYFQQIQKSKRRSKHLVGAQDFEILSVGPREKSRLQALSKEFKKKFNSSSLNVKEEAIEKLFRKTEKINTSIKNASSSKTGSKRKKSVSNSSNQSSPSNDDSAKQPKKKTKINNNIGGGQLNSTQAIDKSRII